MASEETRFWLLGNGTEYASVRAKKNVSEAYGL